MPIVLGLGATTATTQSFTFAGWGASGTIDLQISPNRDFEFAVAPVYRGLARATPYVAPGLNQDATYYARARTVLADGTEEAWSNVVAFRTPLAVARSTAIPSILVEPAVIMRPEPVMGAVWGGATESAGFPIANLFRDAPVATRAKVNRADGLAYFDVVLNGAPADTIALLMTNLPEVATVYFNLSPTSDVPEGAGLTVTAAVPFRASANMPGRPGYHGFFTVPKGNWRSVRVHIGGLGNMGAGLPGGLIHIEHMVIGLNRKSKNHALEKTETPINMGTKERTRTGTPDVVAGIKMRRVEFDLAWLTETISETLYHEIGGWLDETVFVIPNSKAGGYLHDRMLLGDLKTARTTQPSSLHYTRTLAVESLI